MSLNYSCKISSMRDWYSCFSSLTILAKICFLHPGVSQWAVKRITVLGIYFGRGKKQSQKHISYVLKQGWTLCVCTKDTQMEYILLVTWGQDCHRPTHLPELLLLNHLKMCTVHRICLVIPPPHLSNFLQILHVLQNGICALGILQQGSYIKDVIQISLDLHLQLVTFCTTQLLINQRRETLI